MKLKENRKTQKTKGKNLNSSEASGETINKVG